MPRDGVPRPPEAAAILTGLEGDRRTGVVRVTVRAVSRGVEDGSVHFLETADRRLLVCTNSLD